MNSRGERPNKSDSTSLHLGSLATSLEAQCENEATHVQNEHGNIEDDIDSEVEALTENCPVAGRSANQKNYANANAAFCDMLIGGRHSSLDGSHEGLDGNTIDSFDTAFYRNPPTPGNFHDRGIRNLDPMRNPLDSPSDVPVFVVQCHQSHSNHEAVMMSLGHFQDNSMSYGQALQRMNPSFRAREREICEQFERSDQDATEPEHGTVLFGESSDLTYHESFNPRRRNQHGQWRTEDDGNAIYAGVVARELNHAPAIDDNVLTFHQHSLLQHQHSDIAMQHFQHMHRQQEQHHLHTQFHQEFDQNPSSHQTELDLPPSISRRTMTLKEWIDLHKTQNNRSTPSSPSAGHTDHSITNSLSTSQQNYLQQSINIAVKVIKKIMDGMEQSKLRHNTHSDNHDTIGIVNESFDLQEEWEPTPSDVSTEYITVTELTEANHQTDNNDSDDIIYNNNISCYNVKTTIEDINFDVFTDFNWEHSSWAADNKVNVDGEEDAAILHAIAKLLYELLMEGDELPTRAMYASGERPEKRERAANIEGVMEMLQMFASDENMHVDHDDMKDDSGEAHDDVIFAKMRDAALPIPLCRLVSDMFHMSSEKEASTPRSFDRMTLSDVAFDLEQMMDYPDAFLYASRPSRWELLFGNNHMFGRREELAHLMDAASRVVREDSQKEVLLISGHAGSGKSRLVQEIRKTLKERGWKFLRCKFERAIPSDPLSVVALGLDEFFITSIPCPPKTEISSPIVNNVNEDCNCFDHSCQRKIIRELDKLAGLDAIRTLSQWMPSLRKSAKESYPAHIHYFDDGLAQRQQQQQITEQEVQSLIRLLGLLLELVASLCPVLFFVDDLHWADVSTMALLTSLITIVGTSNCAAGSTCSLLFLGTCRINDGITEELVLRHLLQKLENNNSIRVSRISLKGFEIESLNEMMSAVLCLPRRKTLSLSQVIWEKTQGMPLFVVEFVDTLLAEKLLTESEKHGWEWNVDEIRRKPIAEGVAEVLSRKLERLPSNVSKGLQILSCFASRIDLKVINAVKNYDPSDNTDVALAIDVAKREYLVHITGSTVAFLHEAIQIAAFDLIPVMDRIPLLLKLVACLMTNFSSDAADTDVILFATVDLMNRIDSDFASSNRQHSQLFAEYNLKAGKRLVELAKFTPASKYLETGISFLQGTGWVDNYDLTVDLVSNLAKSSYSLGHHQECFVQVNQVLDNATSFEDKFLSYCLYIKLLGIESIDRAVEELFYLLPFAGEPIDPNVITYQMAIDEMMALKQVLSGSQNGMLRRLPLMTDSTRLMSMKLLGLLVLYSSQQKAFLGGYVAVKMIRISLQYGQCDDTVYAMSVFSAALANMINEVDEAYDLAQTTLCLVDNYDTKRLIPRVYALIYGTVLSTKDTISSTLDPLSRACHLAFLHGIHEHSVLNTLIYVAKCLYGGKQLPVLLNELASLAEQHRKINQMNIIIHFLGPMYKTISVLSGVILNETYILSQYVGGPTHDFVESAIAHNELVFVRVAVDIVLFESLITRHFTRAADLILKHSKFFEILNKRHTIALELNCYFVAGLVSFHMARETRDCNWIEKGTNALASYEHWALCNSSNYEHKYFLLKAEYHHLHGEIDAAVQAYDASIESAHKNRFLQHEAIACEMTAHFFGNIGEKRRTKEMIQKSHDVYMEWGAKAKAKSVIELLNLRYLDDTILNTT